MSTSEYHEGVLAAEGLLSWWRDAGVDIAIGEVHYGWLAATTKQSAAFNMLISPVADAIPQTLDALIDHLMTADIVDAGPPSRRIGPAGSLASGLMILTDHPDTDDLDTGALLSSPVFTKMLAAIGKDRSSVYIASLCPGRPITGRLSDESISALTAFAKQHIALAAPKQLWLVGSAASRAILGFDDATARGKLHKVNHAGLILDTIATAHPRMFGESPSRKATAWGEMQRLMLKEDV